MDHTTTIGILGFGVEGRETFRYLTAHGYTELTIFEQSEKVVLPDGVAAVTGADYLKYITECSVLFRSPGISPLHPALLSAQKKGVRITSQTEYFLEQAPCMVIGVTGTKGKGTTSTLLTHVLKTHGKDVYLGGNIGEPPLTFLDALTPESYVVLELSSFQLMDVSRSPHISVLLNVTQDHLDYHQSLDEYHQAKAGIVRFQKKEDVVVYNADYPVLEHYLSLTPAKAFPVSTRKELETGAYVLDSACTFSLEGKKKHILFAQEFGLLGAFNYENILPSVVVSEYLGLPLEQTREAIRSFHGLPHRLEKVDTLQGVEFYNDSFSTVPETAIAALTAFPQKRIRILLGGSEKHSDFTELGKALVKNPFVREVIFLGTTSARRIEQAMEEANMMLGDDVRILHYEPVSLPEGKDTPLLKISYAADLHHAFTIIAENLSFSDVVLLSPGCASFDLFKDYKERGQKFREEVAWLKGEL